MVGLSLHFVLQRQAMYASLRSAYLMVQFVSKSALAVDGYVALRSYLARDPHQLLMPLPHATESTWAFVAVNAVDMVAHAGHPFSHTYLHHVVAMSGSLMCLMHGGFAPSIVRMILIMEVVTPWYKGMRMAKTLGHPTLVRWMSAGAIAATLFVRVPFVVWLAATLYHQLRAKWALHPLAQPVSTGVWAVLLAICPISMRIDAAWTAQMMRILRSG